MNNGKSRFIGALDDDSRWYYKDCSWTSFQYLCAQENGGGGTIDCGTVLPSYVEFWCASGYMQTVGGNCIPSGDARPARPPCGPGNPAVGNPIILSTGSKFISREDFATQDGKFRIGRTYRSHPVGRAERVRSLPIGLPAGWQFDFEVELQIGRLLGSASNELSTVLVIAPGGAGYDFRVKSNGSWNPNPDSGEVSYDYRVEHVGPLPSNLETLANAPSEWIVTGPDETKWLLRTMAPVNSPNTYLVARPITKTERDGYQWTFTYSASDGSLSSITDSFGRTASFTWNKFYITSLSNVAGAMPIPETVQSITFPDGTQAHYSFDPAPASSGPTTNGSATKLLGIEWRDGTNVVVDHEAYHYEDPNFPDYVTGITDHRNVRTATYTYDDSGRVLTTEGADGQNKFTVEYSSNSNASIRHVTNPLNKAAVYTFSKFNFSSFDKRLTSVAGEASTHCVASNSSLTYDGSGFVATQTDEEGRVTAFVRDARGRPTQITEASGTTDARVTTIVWHSTYNVPTSIARPGLTTTYSYNTSGQLTSKTETDTTTHTLPYATTGQSRTWTYTYTTGGLVASIDGPLPGTGDTASYTYDANGYVATFTNEVGHVYTVLATNGRGQPTQLQDPNGVIENLSYDARGRLLSDTVDPTGINAPTLLEYDNAGNVTKVTQPNGSFLTFQYDGNDRVTKLTNNGGETIDYTYDLMGNVTLSETKNASASLFFKTQNAFDELGRLINVVRSGSATWSYGYDKVGNVVSVTDPNSNATASTYDKLNRLVGFADERTSVTSWAYGPTEDPTSTTDPNSVTTGYVRNGWSEVILEQSADIGTVVYQRDQRGKISSRTDARGIVSNFTYDDIGRPLTVTYPAEASSNIAYTYDAGANGNGRLTSVNDAAGSLTKTYDTLGRVTQETRTIGSHAYTTAYQWDDAGKLTQITYPSGREIQIGRDANGNIEHVYTQSATAQFDGLAWWVGHTPFGPTQGITHGNQLSDWRFYDEDKRTVTIGLTDPSVSPAVEFINRWHGYWDNRNLVAIVDNLDASRNANYWYTPNGFMQNADGPWGSLSFYVDGAGNRRQRILEVGSSTTTDDLGLMPGTNRVSQVLTNSVQTRAFGWDASGNITTDTNTTTSTTKTFGYNAPGNVASVTVGTQLSGQYTYDYLSRLTIRSLPTSSTTLHYVHDLDGNIIAEYDSSGTLLREYAWADERPLAVVANAGSSSPTIYHVHTDHLERPIMMTDGAKNVVWRATYLPHGEVYTITGSATLDQRFPGQWFQLESGLHYNWHRHYDPTLGRYIQPDPLGMPDGPNRWTYVNHSPLMNIDREGLWYLQYPPSPLPFPFSLPYPVPGNPPNACVVPGGIPPIFGGPLLNNGGDPPASLPEGLLGVDPRPSSGKGINTGAKPGDTPQGVFDSASGGQTPTAQPDGSLVAPNGVRYRPARVLPNGSPKGARVDIPGNPATGKPPETIHWD